LRSAQAQRRRIKIIITCLAIVVAIYVGTAVLGAATAMEIPRLPLNGSPASVGLAFQDVAFESRIDDVPLSGWFIPSSGDAVLVMINGGFQNRVDPVVDTLALAHDLAQKGYNILLFDLRGRGDSGGKAYSLSNENKDIGGAIDYLEGRDTRPITSALSGFVPVLPMRVSLPVKIRSAVWCLMLVFRAFRIWSITRLPTMVFRGC